MKNIVICYDGTGNEFGEGNSNVVKLYSVLEYSSSRQVAYYHPGLGTMGSPNALGRLEKWWTRQLGLAVGYGLTKNIGDGYAFLMDQFESGDRVFLFGFSRGAYTARALASMLHMFGLIRAGNDELIAYAARMLKRPTRKSWRIAEQFKATFSRECIPNFVGVWDTVSSVGWLYDPVTLPYTANNPDINIARQAISVDERRCCFRQNLWGTPAPNQDMKQVWFSGVHSDVGGSYLEEESGLAKITLAWMIREAASAGLIVDTKKVDRILGRTDQSFARADPTSRMHNSLRGAWLLLEVLPRRFYDTTCTPPRYRWKVPLGARRHIGANAVMHESVLMRMQRCADYRPENIPQTYDIEKDP
jgi:uncharacterized protein (DUF2235 family)